MNKPLRYKINTSVFAFYWKNGIGKDLLKKIESIPAIEDAEKLTPYLFEWNHLEDQIIIDIYLKTGLQEGNKSLEAYLNKTVTSSLAHQIWGDFFSKIDIRPDWLDVHKLKIGAEFCRRPGLSALIVLRDYCLMLGYESAAFNKPLIYTGSLREGAVKRLTDTVEFWVQITKENGLNVDQEGFKQIFMTRMIRSYTRLNILEKTDWESEKWGIPINTWDMLATNLVFSLIFLIGLRKMGIQPTKEESQGLFHFWKYVGYLLGIPLALLPDSEEEAIHSFYLWSMTQQEADDDSRALAKALYEEPIQSNYPKDIFSRKMMREIHLYYNHYFLGDYFCENLGLPKTTVGRFGIINIWQAKKQQACIIDKSSRLKAVEEGGAEQEKVRIICQENNK